MIIGKPKYFKTQEVYLYIGGSCVLVTILSHAMKKSREWVYEIDCSRYDHDLILQNVPERFLGETVNKKKGMESFNHSFIEGLVGR